MLPYIEEVFAEAATVTEENTSIENIEDESLKE